MIEISDDEFHAKVVDCAVGCCIIILLFLIMFHIIYALWNIGILI